MYINKITPLTLSRFCIYYLLVCVAAFATNVIMEREAHAESKEICQQYSEAAVKAFHENEANGCRFNDARWQSNYNNHFNWCLSAPAEWVKKETQFRANQLRVCRSDQKAVECNKYAILSVSDQQSNLSVKCGFTGQRWQSNQDEHLNWCLQVPLETANRELKIRSAMLGICDRQPNYVRCDVYAKQASAQVAEALSRGCNFTGERWNPSYEDHLTWCIGQSEKTANSEAREREGPLSQCRTTNPLQGGAQIHGEQCIVSVVISNRSCLNVDGTSSSLTPGSSSASGCGNNVENARARAKVSFNSTFGCLNDGDTPKPGCCTINEEIIGGCLCH